MTDPSSVDRRTVTPLCGAHARVVVEQQAQWHNVGTGEPQDRLVIGSEFVGRGRIARYVRHDHGVADALAAAGLDEQRHVVTSRRR